MSRTSAIRRGLISIIPVLLALVAVVAAFQVGLRVGADHDDPSASPSPVEAPQEFTCSMHPQVRTTDGAALCPLCAMELTPVESEPGATDSGHESHGAWLCPMHPQVRSDDPEATCPLCGMDLVPAEEHDTPSTEPSTEPSPPGLRLSPDSIAAGGIRTALVTREFPEKQIRLIGRIAVDETSISRITAYFPGRLERLFVDYTGVPVRAGEHLAEIYSPELMTAVDALRQARRAVREQRDVRPTMRVLTEATEEAAVERLRRWGLTREQIDALADGGDAERATIYAPTSGVVLERLATQGDYLRTGDPIYTVADLDRLWLLLDAYESHLPWLRIGQRVRFETDALPGERFEGRVAFIAPTVTETTRTTQIRVNVENPDRRLRPGMYTRAAVRARIAGPGQVIDDSLAGRWISPMHPEVVKDKPGSCDVCGMPLVRAEELGYRSNRPDRAPIVIPTSAALITGTRAVVYVELPAEPGRFEGREVRLGPRAGDRLIVESGLHEGERIVIDGAFTLDSEMQIAARPSMMAPEPAR